MYRPRWREDNIWNAFKNIKESVHGMHRKPKIRVFRIQERSGEERGEEKMGTEKV